MSDEENRQRPSAPAKGSTTATCPHHHQEFPFPHRLSLIPRDGSTPEAVVVEEIFVPRRVRRSRHRSRCARCVRSARKGGQKIRRVGVVLVVSRVVEGSEGVVVPDHHTGDMMAPVAGAPQRALPSCRRRWCCRGR